MTRSRKDGRHGGGHHEKRDRDVEYWSPRGKPMMTPGRKAKRLTHRMERREWERELLQLLRMRYEAMFGWRE